MCTIEFFMVSLTNERKIFISNSTSGSYPTFREINFEFFKNFRRLLIQSFVAKKFPHVLVDLLRLLLLNPVTCRWNVLDLEVRDPFCRSIHHGSGQGRVLGSPDNDCWYIHLVATRWMLRLISRK